MNEELPKLRTLGCGDSGCIFGPPAGMATNGGCRCFTEPKSGRDEHAARIRYHQAIRVARELEKRNEELRTVLNEAYTLINTLENYGRCNVLLASTELKAVMERIREVL